VDYDGVSMGIFLAMAHSILKRDIKSYEWYLFSAINEAMFHIAKW